MIAVRTLKTNYIPLSLIGLISISHRKRRRRGEGRGKKRDFLGREGVSMSQFIQE
jgi:hypothetical protein